MVQLEVPRHLHRSLTKQDDKARRSGRALLADLAARLGRPDLDGVSVLDVGCGVKFTEALVNDDLPIGSYTGIDVYSPVIEFLTSAVDDPRFSFHHVDFHNARYNPDGVKMTAESRFPVGDSVFDLICGFSLFTHLDPDDFVVMLAIMRRHAAPDGRLVFTAFIDERTGGGHGLVDQYHRALGDDIGPHVPYRDFAPDDVLRVALYSEEYARELVDRSDWRLISIDEPTPYAQHTFTLAPR